jgi:predicted transcriptional regulator
MKEFLEELGYRVADFRGSRSSVDIVARRDRDVIILKLLGSAEALKPHHAEDMRKLAYMLDGRAVVVAERNRYGRLEEGVS